MFALSCDCDCPHSTFSYLFRPFRRQGQALCVQLGTLLYPRIFPRLSFSPRLCPDFYCRFPLHLYCALCNLASTVHTSISVTHSTPTQLLRLEACILVLGPSSEKNLCKWPIHFSNKAILPKASIPSVKVAPLTLTHLTHWKMDKPPST